MPTAAATRRHPLSAVAVISVVFALTVVCYWPSLSGPFMFDDVPNLELLGDRGGLDSFDTYVEFISSAQAGPLGRPVSLISFTINGRNWPTDPFPFRVTNLIIHLVNGLLVLLLARSIFATRYDDKTALKLGLICMALWLLHPLLVSSTAYIIQRMTQLASLFVMTGLLCYLHGRKLLAELPWRGWTWIVAGMGISGTLAVLSKESGVLLPLYALVMELTLFESKSLPLRHRRSLVALLCAPLLLILGYFVSVWDGLHFGFEFRPYSLEERLLTQGVVIVEYLRQIFAPAMSGLGFVHDDFPVSTSLLRPPATLVSLIVIVALAILAIWRRKKWPILSFGILWFLAGHSLEAGPIALELYFEHRNYLPMIGPLVIVCSLIPMLPDQLRRVVPVVLVLFFCFEAFLTWQSAKLWSDQDFMMRVALVDHPGSLRARQHVANTYILAGQYEQALEVQQSIAASFPEHTSTRLSILNLQCLSGTLRPEQVDATHSYVENGPHDFQLVSFFQALLSTAARRSCDSYSLTHFQETLDAVLRNPTMTRNPTTRGAAHYFKGIAYGKAGQIDAAVEQLDLSYGASPEIDIPLQQVVWLLSQGRADEAETYLDRARQHLGQRFWRRGLREADLQTLQQRIDETRRPALNQQPP